MMKVELFGGAIVSDLPNGFFSDISQVRQVPDNQEVFLYTKSESDIALIVELIDSTSTSGMTDEEAAAFYYYDLAAINSNRQNESANESVVLSSYSYKAQQNMSLFKIFPKLSTSFSRQSLVGVQRVRKGRALGDEEIAQGKNLGEDVVVILAMIRLSNVNTDLLVTLSIPINAIFTSTDHFNDASTWAECIPNVEELLFAASERHATPSVALKSDFLTTTQALRMFLDNLDIVNWSLFAA